MLVYQHDASNHAAIIAKVRVPVFVGENDIGSAVRAVLIGGMKETSEIGLHAQAIKIVAAGFLDPGAAGIVACIECHFIDVVSEQSLKAVIAVPQVDVVGIRL